MATINLAPGTQYLVSLRRRRRGVFALATVLLVGVILAMIIIGLFKYSAEQQLQAAQTDLRAVETQIAAMRSDVARITLFEQRLETMESLLAGHISWTPFFKDLERLLPAPTVVIKLNADTHDGLVKMSGTSPNIDEVAQALASLKTSEARPTIFSDANLQSVIRKEVANPDAPGTPGTALYDFVVELPFNVRALQTLAPAEL